MINLQISDNQKPHALQELLLRPEMMSNGECLIGRSSKAGLVLDGVEISRYHAKIFFHEHRYYFVDLGSSCGSNLNNQTVAAQQSYKMSAGDVIVIGRFMITIAQMGDPDEETIMRLPAEPTPDQYMPVAAIAPDQFTRWQKGNLQVRCAEIIDETHDVKTFRFVAEPPLLFSYKPGQFITLELDINGAEVLRSYSISSTPSRPHSLEITVKRVPEASPDLAPGLVSNWLHDNLQVGSTIKLSGPLGKFSCFQHPSRKLLFISAGSGITPMMGMSRWLCDTAADCEMVFLHSARTPADIIYHQELLLLSARHQNFRPIVTVTQAQSGQGWLGLTGRLNPRMLEVMIPDFSERMIFVCGPAAFMTATKEMMLSLNFPMEQYHEESFGGSKNQKSSKPVSPKPAPVAKNNRGLRKILLASSEQSVSQSHNGFSVSVSNIVSSPVSKPIPTGSMVVFQKSNQEVISDNSTSILELAEQAGVKIRSSCRSGACGTCKQKKIAGIVKMEDFDPEALEPSEQSAGYILTCVSYPEGKVVIDA
jgi:glycine betaine catabolism B